MLGVIDGDLTVAPGGLGSLGADAVDPGLREAWADELADGAARLAAALGDRVLGWEILPMPNAGSPPRITPARWAFLLARTADAIHHAAPGVPVVAGALVSDESDDGVDYLRSALHAGKAVITFAPEATPFPGVDTNPVVLMIRAAEPKTTAPTPGANDPTRRMGRRYQALHETLEDAPALG